MNARPRVLVAGIGNIFCGDDGFGCAVAQELARRELPPQVRVVDFGTRGFDLACALLEGYELAILVDAIDRGSPPGSLHLLELGADEAGPPAPPQGHGLHPAQVLQLARQMGGTLPRLLLVGCQPAAIDADSEKVGLSAALQAAVEPAIRLVLSLAGGSV